MMISEVFSVSILFEYTYFEKICTHINREFLFWTSVQSCSKFSVVLVTFKMMSTTKVCISVFHDYCIPYLLYPFEAERVSLSHIQMVYISLRVLARPNAVNIPQMDRQLGLEYEEKVPCAMKSIVNRFHS